MFYYNVKVEAKSIDAVEVNFTKYFQNLLFKNNFLFRNI